MRICVCVCMLMPMCMGMRLAGLLELLCECVHRHGLCDEKCSALQGAGVSQQCQQLYLFNICSGDEPVVCVPAPAHARERAHLHRHHIRMLLTSGRSISANTCEHSHSLQHPHSHLSEHEYYQGRNGSEVLRRLRVLAVAAAAFLPPRSARGEAANALACTMRSHY